jgi:hypothetical protein
MKDNEYIAKIIIVFSLKTNEKVEYVNLVESKKPIHINEL